MVPLPRSLSSYKTPVRKPKVPEVPEIVPAAVVAPDPTQMWPFNPGTTVYGDLYSKIVALDAAALLKAGGTMTGMLDINLPGDTGVIAQFRHQGITDVFISTSGNMHVRGNLGVGPFADTPTDRFRIHEPEIEFWSSNVSNNKSGGRGWHINKIPADIPANEVSSVVSFDIDDIPRWEIGIDFETQQVGLEGNSDFVVAYDHSAGEIDDGTLEDTGADVIRLSPASHTTVGVGPKINLSYRAGSPAAFTEFLTIDAGKSLGGARISVNNDVTKTALVMAQRAATHNRLSTSLANANDAAPLWEYGVDLFAEGLLSWGYSFRDHKTVATKDTRLFIEGTDRNIGRIGVNTRLPMATVHVLSSNAAAEYDTVQTHFLASYEDTGLVTALQNRAVSLQTILDATSVRNYLWLSGTLGTTATRATPTVTSTGAGAFGIERTDDEISIVYAAAGTNSAVNRALRVTSGGNIGAFGVNPVARQSIGAAATDEPTTMALANNIRTALINLGWCQA